VFKRQTLLGKAFEAVSADRDAGELMGISATHTVMLSYALSGVVRRWPASWCRHHDGGPTMASALVLKAFFRRGVAGLESGFGVVAVACSWAALESIADSPSAAGGGEVRARPSHSRPGRTPDRRLRQDDHPQGLRGADRHVEGLLLIRGAELLMFAVLAAVPLAVHTRMRWAAHALAIYGILLIGLDVTVGYWAS